MPFTSWRWPRSARHVRIHAMLAAAVMWSVAAFILTLGANAQTVMGAIKGPDFLQFYTMGTVARTHQTSTLSDFHALHTVQVELVPESADAFYPPVYPPQTAAFFAPLSVLSYQEALWLWTLVTIAGLALVLGNVWRSVAIHLPDKVFVAVVVAAFPPIWSIVINGQITFLVIAAFWAGWKALEHRRPFLAGLAFGLLFIKPQFGIPLAFIVLVCREWAMLAGAVTSAALQVSAATALLGWSVFPAYARFVPVMLQNADWLESKPFNSHSLRALTRLTPDWIGYPLWGVLALALLVIAVKVWRSAAPLGVRMATILFASVLVNPHLIVYDAAVLAPALIWFGADVQKRGSRAEAAAFWTALYWLFVSFLAPTAAAINIQVSVLLMVWLLVLATRRYVGAEVPADLSSSASVSFPATVGAGGRLEIAR